MAAALAALLVPASGYGLERILLGLADLRGLDTFRSVERTKDGAVRDVSRLGLRAGVTRSPTGEVESEVRAVFKPTVHLAGQALVAPRVVEVGLELGGGIATMHRLDQPFSGQSLPEDVFSLPVSPLTTADLVAMFQKVVDSGGESTVTSGIMLRSTRPLSGHNQFSARFTVRVEESAPWTVTGGVRLLPTGRQVLEFRSSRRGRATFRVNGVARLENVPVAKGANYRFDVPGLAAGTNTLSVTVTDPDDGTFQTLEVFVQG